MVTCSSPKPSCALHTRFLVFFSLSFLPLLPVVLSGGRFILSAESVADVSAIFGSVGFCRICSSHSRTKIGTMALSMKLFNAGFSLSPANESLLPPTARPSAHGADDSPAVCPRSAKTWVSTAKTASLIRILNGVCAPTAPDQSRGAPSGRRPVAKTECFWFCFSLSYSFPASHTVFPPTTVRRTLVFKISAG